jgi:hypothetical protein
MVMTHIMLSLHQLLDRTVSIVCVCVSHIAPVKAIQGQHVRFKALTSIQTNIRKGVHSLQSHSYHRYAGNAAVIYCFSPEKRLLVRWLNVFIKAAVHSLNASLVKQRTHSVKCVVHYMKYVRMRQVCSSINYRLYSRT